MESYLARRCPGAMLDSLQIAGLQPDGDTLKMSYRLHTSMFAVRQGSALVIHPGWLSGSGLSEYFRSHSRVLPVRFRFGNTSESLLTVHLPEGWSMVTPELPDSLESPFGSARWNCHAEGPLLTWRSTYSFQGKEIAPARFGEFREFLDAMQAGDMTEIEVGRTVQAGLPKDARPDSPAR